jgi:hypothetical protein
MNQEKCCSNCSKWTSTKTVHCRFCGEELYKKERLIKESIEAQPDPFILPLIKISTNDGYLLVFGKRIIQTVQLVFFGIISILIWIASILPG